MSYASATFFCANTQHAKPGRQAGYSWQSAASVLPPPFRACLTRPGIRGLPATAVKFLAPSSSSAVNQPDVPSGPGGAGLYANRSTVGAWAVSRFKCGFQHGKSALRDQLGPCPTAFAPGQPDGFQQAGFTCPPTRRTVNCGRVLKQRRINCDNPSPQGGQPHHLQ